MFQLADIFQNGMILQREKEIELWGSSDTPDALEVFLNGTTIWQGEIPAGDFSLALPQQPAMENAYIIIKAKSGQRMDLSNVDVGEVWIAGGQSNMEFLFKYDKDYERVMASGTDEHIRYYDVEKIVFEGEKEEGLKDCSHWGRWIQLSGESSAYFSAVGTYFAMKIRNEFHVPVGIVGCNLGGTTAATWVDEKLLRQEPKLEIYVKTFDAATSGMDMKKYNKMNRGTRENASKPENIAREDGNMKVENTVAPNRLMRWLANYYRKCYVLEPFIGSRKKLKKKMADGVIRLLTAPGPKSPNRPGGLYEMMVKKIVGFSCKGVLWYQGENDYMYADLYSTLFSLVISCWRKQWNEELPFLFVQLAPLDQWLILDGRDYPELRQQQQIVEDTVANAWMASIMDVGGRYDIHPKDKRPVGERLALLALSKVYGLNVPCEAPRIKSIERSNNRVFVKFANAEGGLVARGSLEGLFELKSNGKNISSFSVSVEEDTVILEDKKIQTANDLQISFAYQAYLVMSLYNEAGLPAKPFAPVMI